MTASNFSFSARLLTIFIPYSCSTALGFAHAEFLSHNVKSLIKDGGVIYDVKGVFKREIIDGRL